MLLGVSPSERFAFLGVSARASETDWRHHDATPPLTSLPPFPLFGWAVYLDLLAICQKGAPRPLKAVSYGGDMKILSRGKWVRWPGDDIRAFEVFGYFALSSRQRARSPAPEAPLLPRIFRSRPPSPSHDMLYICPKNCGSWTVLPSRESRPCASPPHGVLFP